MHKYSERPFLFIALCTVGVLGVMTSFIIYEYRTLVRQIDELIQVKQEYNNYLLLFKRAMLENDRIRDLEKDDACDNAEKKKIDNTPEETVVWVNRNQQHLAARARSYSRQQNVEVPRFEQDTVTSSVREGTTRRTKKQMRRRKRTKKRRSWVAEDSQVMLASPDEIAFIWPVAKKNFWVSYGFGPRRHPSGRWEFHRGVDLAAPLGTPVFSAADGVVVQAESSAGGYGKVVVVEHTSKFKTRYAHLSRILVNVGDELRQGDILGKVGATGNVRGKNGVHLHFEVMVYDKRVNPFYFLT